MLRTRLPTFVSDHNECHEWKLASAILSQDFAAEWNAIPDLRQTFRLDKSWMVEPGGGAGCPLLVFGITKALYLEDVK